MLSKLAAHAGALRGLSRPAVREGFAFRYCEAVINYGHSDMSATFDDQR